MSKLPKPRAIVFDWDNTLVDTWPTIHEALNNTLRHMKHPEWSLEKVRSNVKQSMRDSFPGLFGDRWQEAAKHYQDSYLGIHLGSLKPLPGAEDMLRALPDSLFVAIVSNKKGPTLRKELEHMGWAGFFDAAIGADDASRDKPHPEPVFMALTKLEDELGDHVWFIGDTAVDLECALAVGATPVLFGDIQPDPHMHEGFPYKAHVRDHEELKKLILENL